VTGGATIVVREEVRRVKYVLMFCETEQFVAERAALTEADRERGFVEVQRWLAEHADKITHRAKLEEPETATTVRLGGGEPIVTDGPFVEGKEVISGYVEVEVADLDEALKMAASWPACPTVEIRPVLF
jgi:hypothetical protein